MENLEKQILELEQERIKNLHWSDITLKELKLLGSKEKRNPRKNYGRGERDRIFG